MPAPLYTINTESAVALSAATARTILGAKAHANSGLVLKKIKISFDGVTSSAIPPLIEVVYSTWATKSPGTNSTSCTVVQKNGRVLAAGFTGAHSWAAANEPTTLSLIEQCYFPAFMGSLFYDIPLGDEYDCALAEGFAIRVTAAATVNVRASMDLSRC